MAGSGCALRRSSTRRITQRKASFEEMPLEVPASASSPPYDKVRLPGQSFGEAGMQPDFLRRFLDLKIVLKRIGGISIGCGDSYLVTVIARGHFCNLVSFRLVDVPVIQSDRGNRRSEEHTSEL